MNNADPLDPLMRRVQDALTVPLRPLPDARVSTAFGGGRGGGSDRVKRAPSRTQCAGDQRDHDQERSKRGDLGDVTQGVSSDIVHLRAP